MANHRTRKDADVFVITVRATVEYAAIGVATYAADEAVTVDIGIAKGGRIAVLVHLIVIADFHVATKPCGVLIIAVGAQGHTASIHAVGIANAVVVSIGCGGFASVSNFVASIFCAGDSVVARNGPSGHATTGLAALLAVAKKAVRAFEIS